jgi:hypothetical protein
VPRLTQRADEERAMRQAVYNSRIPNMRVLSLLQLRVVSHLLAFYFLAGSVLAADWSTPAGQLAQKIAAKTGPGAVAVEFVNRSSVSKGDFDDARRALTTELAALGLHFVNPEQAAAAIQISLSENPQSYLWIAQIQAGPAEPSVVIISTSRTGTIVAAHEAAPLTIHKTMLWAQEARILDAAILDGNSSHLAVLDPDQVSLYKMQDGRWQLEQSLTITHANPWPRDLRGRLILRRDHLFDVFLPGVTCQSSNSGSLRLNCRASDDPWPVGFEPMNMHAFFAPARNFFPGVLAPGEGKQTTAPAFYNIAPLPRNKYVLWVVAAVDGQIHLLDGIRDQMLLKTGWGSEIASVKSTCGAGWQLLASQEGNGTPDAVRAFEIADREPSPASSSLEFPGPITAMWTESGGDGAIAVENNAETGKYEAYRLSVACGQ